MNPQYYSLIDDPHDGNLPLSSSNRSAAFELPRKSETKPEQNVSGPLLDAWSNQVTENIKSDYRSEIWSFEATETEPSSDDNYPSLEVF